MELRSAELRGGYSAIDPDEADRLFEDGRTLPPVFYTNPEIHELEQQVILRRSWQIALSAAFR